MHTRQNELNKWLHHSLDKRSFTITPLAGDASFRKYYRLFCDERTYVVMDAPPDKEDIRPFVHIGHLLATNGVHTPQIIAVEWEKGFILLEDFGDKLLINSLSDDKTDQLYKIAIRTLLLIQQCPTHHPSLPKFNKAFMLQELALFHEWFLNAYLSLQLSSEETLLLKDTFDWLTTEISKQPQLFLHRDYHARNLMVLDPNHPDDMGVIDFQDAMRGPFTYDLVSLLKDCYVQWPREQVLRWLTYFYNHLPNTHGLSLEAFTEAFDLCGLQRHLKVLGVFCRLHLRDQKKTYLQHLPLTLNYVSDCAKSHDPLHSFYQFIQAKVSPALLRVSS
jgi:aminoglycoside/choline kinase family phosphotransferase